jgi:hypothetical protein
MKFLKIIIAVLITLAVLGYARKTSVGRSAKISIEKEGIKIEQMTTPKQEGETPAVIKANVSNASTVKLFYKVGDKPEYEIYEMKESQSEKGLYETSVPTYPKGIRGYYYIEASSGQKPALIVTLPDKSSPKFKPVTLKYQGKPPAWLILIHVLTAFIAVFFAVLSVFSAWRVKKDNNAISAAIINPLLAVISMFVSFFPSGFAMNWYTFGTIWEAFPFGKDITDNKSQIIFLAWLLILILFKGSLFGKSDNKNLVGSKLYFPAVSIAFLVMLIIYAIPHSL